MKKTKLIFSIIMAAVMICVSAVSVSAEEESAARTELVKLLESHCWDFDYIPEYWYTVYTKESYDAYNSAKKNAEKLLADENATDDDFRVMIEEFQAAHDGLVSLNNPNPVAPFSKALGDANGDNKYDLYDAAAVQLYLAGLYDGDFFASVADVDGDDELTILDASYMQLYFANLL